ncbi:hypothetical protein JB92DRAFT_3100425, partial [Gautieria morchelliformis]
MARRVPCGICHLQSSSPNNFLLLCACGTACHHRCLKPPMAQSSLLTMIDAFNRGVHEKSFRAWRCATCTGRDCRVGNRPPLPVSALPSSTLGDKDVRYRSAMDISGRHGKYNRANGRVHGWRANAPASLNHSRSKLHGSPTAVWPPVRHKNKAHNYPALAKDTEESDKGVTDPRMKVAPSRQGGHSDNQTSKTFVRHSPIATGPRLKPDLDALYTSGFVFKAPSNSHLHVFPIRKSAGRYLPSRGHAISKDLVNDSDSVTKIDRLITSDTPPKQGHGHGARDVIMDHHPATRAGSKNENVIQLPFPAPSTTKPRHLYNFPWSPTSPGRPDNLTRQPSAVIQSLSRQNASFAPSVSTPPYRRAPLIDLHKVLKRKRDSVSRQGSCFEGYPLKRVKLDKSNTQTEGNLPTQNDNILA